MEQSVRREREKGVCRLVVLLSCWRSFSRGLGELVMCLLWWWLLGGRLWGVLLVSFFLV